jgi:hypothetical protein
MSTSESFVVRYPCGSCLECDVEKATRPKVEEARDQFVEPLSVRRVLAVFKCSGFIMENYVQACKLQAFGFFVNNDNEVVGRFNIVDEEIKTIREFLPLDTADGKTFDLIKWAEKNNSLQSTVTPL